MLQVKFSSWSVFLRLSVLLPFWYVSEFLNFSKLEEQNSGKLPKYFFFFWYEETIPDLTNFLKSLLILITSVKSSLSFPACLSCSVCVIVSGKMGFLAKLVYL